jgi:hypothetical protein
MGARTFLTGTPNKQEEDKGLHENAHAVRPCSGHLLRGRHKRPQAVRVMHVCTTTLSSLGVTNMMSGLSSHSMSAVCMCRMDCEWDLMSGPASKQ